MACSADGKRAAVSNLCSGTVSLFAIDAKGMKAAGEVPVGPQPRGTMRNGK